MYPCPTGPFAHSRRSRAFCGVIYPWLREHFAPRLDDVSQDAFYRMINKAQPSLIRTSPESSIQSSGCAAITDANR